MRSAKRRRMQSVPWLDSEIAVIKQMYSDSTHLQLMEALPGRTKTQIGNRATLLGIKKTSEFKSRTAYKGEVIWSDEEVLIMTEKYQVSNTETILSLLPGKELRQIYSKAVKLNIHKKERSKKRVEKIINIKAGQKSAEPYFNVWTDAELNLLKEKYPKSQWFDMVRMLPGRDKKQIRNKAAKMGLKKASNFVVQRIDIIVSVAKKRAESKPKAEQPRQVKKYDNKPIDKSNPVKIGDSANTTIYAKPGRNHNEVRAEYFEQRKQALKNFSRWD